MSPRDRQLTRLKSHSKGVPCGERLESRTLLAASLVTDLNQTALSSTPISIVGDENYVYAIAATGWTLGSSTSAGSISYDYSLVRVDTQGNRVTLDDRQFNELIDLGNGYAYAYGPAGYSIELSTGTLAPLPINGQIVALNTRIHRAVVRSGGAFYETDGTPGGTLRLATYQYFDWATLTDGGDFFIGRDENDSGSVLNRDTQTFTNLTFTDASHDVQEVHHAGALGIMAVMKSLNGGPMYASKDVAYWSSTGSNQIVASYLGTVPQATGYVEANGMLFVTDRAANVYRVDGSGITNIGSLGVGHARYLVESTASGVILFENTHLDRFEIWQTSPAGNSIQFTGALPVNPGAYWLGRVADGKVFGQSVGTPNGGLWNVDLTTGEFNWLGIDPSITNNPSMVFASFDGGTAFAGRNTAYGIELFVTEGDFASTRLLADFIVATAPTNIGLVAQGDDGYAYFTVQPQQNSTTRQLWRTDGTDAGTEMLAESIPTPTAMVAHAGLVILYSNVTYTFSIQTRTYQSVSFFGLPDPKRMLGTVAIYVPTNTSTPKLQDWATGTSEELPISVGGVGGSHLGYRWNGKLYFSSGLITYESDGTAAGTQPIDFGPPTPPLSESHTLIAVVEGRLIYSVRVSSGANPGYWICEPGQAPRRIGVDLGLHPSQPVASTAAIATYQNTLYFWARKAGEANPRIARLDVDSGEFELLNFSGQSVNQPALQMEYYAATRRGLMFTASGSQTRKFIASGQANPVDVPMSTSTYWLNSFEDSFYFAAKPSGDMARVYRFDGFESVEVDPQVTVLSVQTRVPILPSGLFFAGFRSDVAYEPFLFARDTVMPQVTTFAIDVDQKAIRVEFDEGVFVSSASFRLSSELGAVDLSGWQISALNAREYVLRQPAAQVLPDGNYQLFVVPSEVSDGGANPLTGTPSHDFFILAGDINRDRAVNFDDLLILAQNYGQTGRTYSQGNVNYSADGKVDFDDLLILAQRYGTSLFLASPIKGIATKSKSRSASADLLS